MVVVAVVVDVAAGEVVAVVDVFNVVAVVVDVFCCW